MSKLIIATVLIAVSAWNAEAQQQNEMANSNVSVRNAETVNDSDTKTYSKETIEQDMKSNTFKLAVRPHPENHFVLAFTSEKIDQQGSLKIITGEGKVIMSKDFEYLTNPIELHVEENLVPGTYYMQVTSAQNRSTVKFKVK